MKVFITGGARSGKSTFAEQLAMRVADHGIYIATLQIADEEMQTRVGLHRSQRDYSGFQWETIEEPVMLAQTLRDLGASIRSNLERGLKPPVILVDCLTLWLSNLLMEEEAREAVKVGREGEEEEEHEEQQEQQQQLQTSTGKLEQYIDELESVLVSFPSPVLFVTNEVGSGVVPAYPLGRRFRDEAGRLNQRIARLCDRRFWVVSGIPVDLNKAAFSWEDL